MDIPRLHPPTLLAILASITILACDSSPPPTSTQTTPQPNTSQNTQPHTTPPPTTPPPTLPHIPSALRSPTFPTQAKDLTSPWTRQWPQHSGATLTDTAYLPNGNILVTTHDGELFQIQDNAWSLLHRHSLPLVQVVSVTHPTDTSKSAILTLDQHGRIQISHDSGASFTTLQDPPETLPAVHDPVLNTAPMPFLDLKARWLKDGNIAILASGGTPLALRSMDSGKTWSSSRVGGRNPVFSGAIAPDGSMLIVGDRAQVYLRTPQSSEWTPIHSAKKEPWRAASFLSTDPLKIAAVGVRGRIGLYTSAPNTPHKELWNVTQRPNTPALYDIHTTTPTQWVTVAENGDVLTTRDAGKRWTVSHKGDGRHLNHIAHHPKHGWLLQGPQRLTHLDARTQKRTDLRGRGVHTVLDVHLSKAHRIAVGKSNLYLHAPQPTQPWEPRTDVTSKPADFHSIAFANGQNGWISTHDGALLHTSDIAKTFTRSSPSKSFKGLIFDVQALDVRNLFIGGQEGFVALSNDRGSTFAPLTLPHRKETALAPPNALSLAVTRSSAGVGLLVGAERGMLFERPPLQRDLILHDLGYIGNIDDVESQGDTSFLLDTSGTILRRTGDAKAPWQVLTVPPGTAWSHLTFSKDHKTALLLARDGSLLRSTDSGASWFLAQYPKGRVLQDIIHHNNNLFVGIGHGGLIYQSTDGGQSWASLPPTNGRTLNSIVQASDQSLIACGVSGTCLHTTDPDAKTWTPWPHTPPKLKNSHVSTIALAQHPQHDTVALAVSGAVWLRHQDNPWLLLKASNKDTPHTLREIRRLHTHPSGDVIALGGDGRIWIRAQDNSLLYAPLPKSSNPDDPVGRAKDITITPNTPNLQGHILMTDGRIFSFSHTPLSNTLATQPLSTLPKRTTQAPIGRGTFGAQHTWLLGPGGLWARPNTQDASWHQVLPSLHTRPLDLSFISPKEGYAANLDGSILHTTDGGTSWTLLETFSRTPLHTIYAHPTLGALAGGDNGLVLQHNPKPAPE